jgi:hypothetical protein
MTFSRSKNLPALADSGLTTFLIPIPYGTLAPSENLIRKDARRPTKQACIPDFIPLL